MPQKPAKRTPPGTLRWDVRVRIRNHYKACGLTQTKFADQIGVPRSTVTGWVSADPPLPETTHLVAMATRSGVSIDHLLLGDEPRLRGEPQAAGPIRSEWRNAVIAELLARAGGGSTEDRALMERLVPRPDALFDSVVEQFLPWVQQLLSLQVSAWVSGGTRSPLSKTRGRRREWRTEDEPRNAVGRVTITTSLSDPREALLALARGPRGDWLSEGSTKLGKADRHRGEDRG